MAVLYSASVIQLPQARCVKELIVHTQNQVGLLGEVAQLLADRGINILAVHVVASAEFAEIHLLTSAQLYARDALEAAELPVEEREVVAVELPNRPGFLRKIAEALARQGVDIHYLYATAAEDTARSLVILSCSNNGKAVLMLGGR